MRWMKNAPKYYPRVGEERTGRGFLYFWKCDTKNGQYRWLEYAEWVENYGYVGSDMDGDTVNGWRVKYWVN